MMLNLRDIIKFIYNLMIVLVIFLVYMIISSFFNGTLVDISLLIIVICNLVVFSGCTNSEMKYKTVYGLILILTIILTFFLGKFNNVITYLIINVVIISIAFKNINISKTRDSFLIKLKKIYIFLAMLLFLYPLVDPNIQILFKKIFFIEFALGVTLLRTARSYEYGLNSKKIFRSTVGIVVILFILTSESIIKILRNILRILLDKIDFLLELIIKGISMVFYFLNKLIVLSQFKSNENYIKTESHEFDNKFKDIDITISPIKTFILKTILVLIILTCLILIIRWATKDKKLKINRENIGDEEIKRERLYKDLHLVKKIKKVFTKPKSDKDRVLFAFYILQRKLYKKNLFKLSMTATQIYKVNRFRINNKKELKYVTEKYNEVKFSKHDLERSSYNKYMESYKIVKKEL